MKQENLVHCNNRAIYIIRLDCKLGKKKHEGFAYPGYDVDRASDETHKPVKRLANKKLSDEQFRRTSGNAGLFVVVSSLPYQTDEILPVYYIRQTIFPYQKISSEALDKVAIIHEVVECIRKVRKKGIKCVPALLALERMGEYVNIQFYLVMDIMIF